MVLGEGVEATMAVAVAVPSPAVIVVEGQLAEAGVPM